MKNKKDGNSKPLNLSLIPRKNNKLLNNESNQLISS